MRYGYIIPDNVRYLFIFYQLVIIVVLSDAVVLPRSCFLMHVFFSYVLSLICEAVLSQCLELVQVLELTGTGALKIV